MANSDHPVWYGYVVWLVAQALTWAVVHLGLHVDPNLAANIQAVSVAVVGAAVAWWTHAHVTPSKSVASLVPGSKSVLTPANAARVNANAPAPPAR